MNPDEKRQLPSVGEEPRLARTRLDEIRKRAEAATPGPWRTGWLESYNAATGEPESFVYRLPPGSPEETAHNRICIRGSESMDCDSDSAFIAHSRQDVPWLLDAVEELLGALEYGVNVMMPEIHAQRTLWPGEVDDFEDRARAALAKYGRRG